MNVNWILCRNQKLSCNMQIRPMEQFWTRQSCLLCQVYWQPRDYERWMGLSGAFLGCERRKKRQAFFGATHFRWFAWLSRWENSGWLLYGQQPNPSMELRHMSKDIRNWLERRHRRCLIHLHSRIQPPQSGSVWSRVDWKELISAVVQLDIKP